MSKPRMLLLVVFTALVFVSVGLCVAYPLWRSESSIRAYLLRQTPLGSSIQEVRAFLERRGWLDRSYSGDTGYYFQPVGQPARTVGVSSLTGDLGQYGFPLRVSVTAFWGFDANDRLIDIWVWKTTDAL